MKFITGNILESDADALVNTVNTEGVMGKGIALQFKESFPHNYKVYSTACKYGEVRVGKVLAVRDKSLFGGEKTIINFPTKTSWRKPSEYSYIIEGLKDLEKTIIEEGIKSIAIPALGAGNGGLNWERVKNLIEEHLGNSLAEVLVYEPNFLIQEKLKKERVKLTPARAMLLSVLFELVRSGEFVSEFAAEKVAYFLQKFGAKEEFKLEFNENFYGPYSGKVKHVLYYLNGSYISGYSSKDKKPFEIIELVMDSEKEVDEYLNRKENSRYLEIVQKTKKFLDGYYSNFALELLSTVDFIGLKYRVSEEKEIREKIELWSDRKKNLFANPLFISKAISRLELV
jgi:O-acetyl-ADP-ribose deacetylase (regulator of RNase III)